MAGVEGIPLAIQKGLEPAGEIHRIRVRGHADIAEIACAIARRDIHAAAKRDREVGEIAANADALAKPVGGGAARIRRAGSRSGCGRGRNRRWPGRAPRPSRSRCRIALQAKSLDDVAVAVAARQEKAQDVDRQFGHRRERRVLRRRFRLTGIADQKIAAEGDESRPGFDPRHPVIERIDIGLHRDGWARRDDVGRKKIIVARRMHIELQQHRRRRRAFERDPVACSDDHPLSPSHAMRRDETTNA